MNAIFSFQHLRQLRSQRPSLPAVILLISLVIGFSVTFITSHLLIQHSDKKLLGAYLQSAVNTTDKLYRTIAQAFNQPVDSSAAQMCTKADLKQLRSYLWDHSQLKDIARIQDGNVICSASWGMLAPPIELPAPTKSWEQRGYNHWRTTKDAIQGTVNVNMVTHGNMLVIVSPYAYISILPANKNVGFVVSTSDKSYFAHATGPLAADTVLADDFSSLVMLKQQVCGNRAEDLCVTVYNSRSGIFGKDETYIACVTLIATMISVLIYTSLLSIIIYRGSMKKALIKSLERRELFVVFQPKVSLKTGQIVGMEALARWQHEQFGNVPPDVFIAVAEEYDLMPKLSRLVVEKSLSNASILLNQSPHLQLSINLSMSDLADPMLLDFIDYHRENHGIKTNQLIFEITETSAAGFDRIETSVDQFVERGYRISLDDFGTGYANLSWLSRIRASEIKVDRSFTQMIGSQETNHNNTLNAIFKLLKDLNVSAVFEGIENQEQAEYILSHAQNAIGQGWLYAKPMPIEQLHQFIQERTLSVPRCNKQEPVFTL